MTVLAERKGSITVSALVGTGMATIAVALTGVAGLSDDLRAATLEANPSTTPVTPLLTPEDEVSGPAITDERLRKLHVDCLDHEKSRSEATGGGGRTSKET